MTVYLVFHKNYSYIREPHLLLLVLIGRGDFHTSRYLSFNFRVGENDSTMWAVESQGMHYPSSVGY